MRPRAALVLALVLLVALLAAGTMNYLRPVPSLRAVQTFPKNSAGGPASGLPWPAGAQAAVGVGSGVLAATADPRPLPIASVAKVMAALVTLQVRPLRKGEQGPIITITAADLADYQRRRADGESVVPVRVGEQLTEYQALQALLVPSGNNAATLLARWAAGSEEAFVTLMNAKARAMSLRQTSFADASGVSPATVSTPPDLIRLAEAAMADPVFAEIVAQPQADLPVAGRVYNVNYALGQDGIVGVKTGSSPQAGAVYLFAAPYRPPGLPPRLLFGAVQGLHTLDEAFAAARALLETLRLNLRVERVVARDQVVGRYTAPWGGSSQVVAVADLDLLLLPGTSVRADLRALPLRPPVSPRTVVGSLRVTAGEATYDVPVATAAQLYGPGRLWRLLRRP